MLNFSLGALPIIVVIASKKEIFLGAQNTLNFGLDALPLKLIVTA